MVNASIITIGDELLIGQVIDTNSAWMAQELNKAGISIKRKVSIGDNAADIIDALDQESLHSDIILITGGLGPTADDITKPLLCEYFGGKMVVNEEALENVKYLFEKVFRRPIIPVNLKQAEVPDVCTVIPNRRGTAPGMWFEKENKVYVSMPGVPNEMKGMIPAIIEKLSKKYSFPAIIHKTLLTAGVGESFLAEMIKDFEASLPESIKLAYLPAYGMVRLRLSSTGSDRELVETDMSAQFEELKKLVGEFLVTDEDEPLEKVVGNLLLKQGKSIGTAESCTGGYIAHMITSQPGSSAYFKGSVVAYDNEIKKFILKVREDTLDKWGAVSEEVVREMITGCLNALNVDYALAVSGIMGPDGGTEAKPVGTVWVAVGNNRTIKTQKLSLRFDRQRNIQMTSLMALNAIRKLIVNEK